MSNSPILLEYTPETAAAIQRVMNAPAPSGIKSHHIPVPKQQFIGNTPPQQQRAAAEYNGYFKLVLDRVGEGQYQVIVIDGAYYGHADAHTYRNYCYVNNCRGEIHGWRSVAFTYIEPIPRYICIHFHIDASSIADGYPQRCLRDLDSYLTIEAVPEVPDSTSTDVWYQIGRVIAENNTCRVHQDHITGIPYMAWYAVCGEFDNA